MKIQDFIQQKLTKPIDYLASDQELCTEVQTRLNALGLLPNNGIDGIFGNQTRQAFHQFKRLTYQAQLDQIGVSSAQLLLDLKSLPGTAEVITKTQAEAVYGRTISQQQLTDLNQCLKRFEINNPARLRHFLAQTAHESGGLKWLKELADGSAYEGRRDLGNFYAGDGRRYKGAGVIQLTGRNNYQRFANYLSDPDVMKGCDYVATIYPFTSAGFWWHSNEMNQLCDKGATVEQVTRRVNGGYNGLDDRKRYYRKALQVIPG